MLALYRRHLKTGFGPKKLDPCPHSGDRFIRKRDRCPVYVEGVDPQGRYYRKSLHTTSWDIGERILRGMLIPPPASIPAPVPETPKPEAVALAAAMESFIAKLQGENREADTIRKYRLLFREVKEFADACSFRSVADLTFEKLVAFKLMWIPKDRQHTQKGVSTRNKKLDRLKAFFGYCHDAGFISQNPTRRIKPESAPNLIPEPFSPIEQSKILAKPQERRTRVFTHVLYYSALRISDACMLTPADFDGNCIRRVNKKNRQAVFVPIPPYVKEELDKLLLNGGYYFLIGRSPNVHTQTDAWRTIMNDMFKKDIPGFHCHRFRHTAATNWLASGITIGEVAALLGNSVKVVEKHYGSFSKTRQEVLEHKLEKLWQRPQLVRVK